MATESERLRKIVAHVAGGVAVEGDRAQYKDPDATHRMAPTAWVAFDTRTKIAAIQLIREARALLATPQQEPEGDGWEITRATVDQWVDEYSPPFPAPSIEQLRSFRDFLQARVQPRRVSREEFEAVAKEISTGYQTYADPYEVAIDVLDILGIGITPTEVD